MRSRKHVCFKTDYMTSMTFIFRQHQMKYFQWCSSQCILMFTLPAVHLKQEFFFLVPWLSLYRSEICNLYRCSLTLHWWNSDFYRIRSSYFTKTVKPACSIHVDNRIKENALRNYNKYMHTSCLNYVILYSSLTILFRVNCIFIPCALSCSPRVSKSFLFTYDEINFVLFKDGQCVFV